MYAQTPLPLNTAELDAYTLQSSADIKTQKWPLSWVDRECKELKEAPNIDYSRNFYRLSGSTCPLGPDVNEVIKESNGLLVQSQQHRRQSWTEHVEEWFTRLSWTMGLNLGKRTVS